MQGPYPFDPATAVTDILYAGQALDPLTAQYDDRARDYDPATGTFTTLDSYAGDPTKPISYNKYLYTQADPVNGIDPTGFDLMELNVTINVGTATDNLDESASVATWVKVTAAVVGLSLVVNGGLSMQNGPVTTLREDLATQQQLREDPVSDGEAYEKAKQAAISTGKYTEEEVDEMPIFWVFHDLTPQIFENDALAMAGIDTRGFAKATDVLNYLLGIKLVNRDPALRGPGASASTMCRASRRLTSIPLPARAKVASLPGCASHRWLWTSRTSRPLI